MLDKGLSEEELEAAGWERCDIRVASGVTYERWRAPKAVGFERVYARWEAEAMEKRRRKADGGG